MKFVTSLAFSPLDHYLDIARAAEEAGFDAIALSDHVVHPERIESPYPYTENGKPRWEPFTPWPDPWVAIAAMTAATSRLRFLTSVYVLPMRNPFQVAKAVATAAVISHDRVPLGVGAGWMEEEFKLLEQPFRQRGKRMDEMIEVMRKLWAGGMVEHHGEFFDFDRLQMSPAPSKPVPFYIGGHTDAALRRAARVGDGWTSAMIKFDELTAVIDRLRVLRAEYGRSDLPFEIQAVSVDRFGSSGYAELADAGVTDIIVVPWIFDGHGFDSPLEAKKESLHRFADKYIHGRDAV